MAIEAEFWILAIKPVTAEYANLWVCCCDIYSDARIESWVRAANDMGRGDLGITPFKPRPDGYIHAIDGWRKLIWYLGVGD
jgi:hypothetical protein